MNPPAIYSQYSSHFYNKQVLPMILRNALYPLLYLDVSNHTFKNLLRTFLRTRKRVGLFNFYEGSNYSYSLSGARP